MGGVDDRRLHRCRQIGLQAQCREPRAQTLAIRLITGQPRRLAAFGVVLIEGTAQGGQHMSRRRVAPLAGALQVGVLVVQIQGQRMAVAATGRQRLFFHQYKGHAGHTFQALVGR